MKTLVRFCLNALALASLAVDAADFTLTATPADGQITLNWPAVAGAKAYSLCQARDVISDVDQCTLYPGGRWLDRTRPGYQATGLTNDTAYSFQVVAFNTRDILGVSNVVTVKPGLASPAPTASGSLNDTGITAAQCYPAGSNTLVSCSSTKAIALNPHQDGMQGRDTNAATNTDDDGAKGFSYTKIDGSGQDLPGYASEWDCVRDNVTGLIWEVKTQRGLRDGDKTYTNRNQANNASDAAGFVKAVNAAGLCGANDWRLPTADELQSLVDYGIASPGPTIDSDYFPNTVQGWFWSSSPYVGDTDNAWSVYFDDGNVFSDFSRYGASAVRLVRGG